MQRQSEYILVNHARELLRQHYAIDAGIDSMDWRPLGSDPQDIDEATRTVCRERMDRCKERAHEVIAGLISGSHIDVWREREDGTPELVMPAWAVSAFDGKDSLKATNLFLREMLGCRCRTIEQAESRKHTSST